MIYKPLNDFMIESSLKNSSWDSQLITWLNRNYPDIILNNDSNLWEVIRTSKDEIIDVYKQIKLFLYDEIHSELNITRLKNLICINCFGINIETTDYLLEEMSKYLNCLSIPEASMYDNIKMISNTFNVDILLSYNEKFENTSLPIIFSIRKTLDTNYKRLLANSINISSNKFDKSSTGIMIHYLDKEKFQLVVGVVKQGKVNSANLYKKKDGLKSYLDKLKDNLTSGPGILSANLINDEYIGLFDEGDIIFGYEYLPIKRIIGMNTGDCFKRVDKTKVVDDLFFDSPDSLLSHMSSNAVEILIDMKPEPVTPSYIISIDIIKESEIDAAKILGLPIYVINTNVCYEKRRAKEERLKRATSHISDKSDYLKSLVELYKYQEQTYLINTGCFSNKEEITTNLNETYNKIGSVINEIYNSCILDDNMSIKQRLDNMETLVILNTIITDISLTNNLNSKRVGNTKDFKCFFTEYESHAEFMNSIISKIESKFNTKISTYALICLASLSCNVQDYTLKMCYEEFSQQACDYLNYFKFPYMDLVNNKAFDKINNFEDALVYSDSNTSILLDNNELSYIIKDGFSYDIVAKTFNPSKFSKIKYQYICKNINNKELEVQILNNNNIRIIDKGRKTINYNNFKNIENNEYVINK